MSDEVPRKQGRQPSVVINPHHEDLKKYDSEFTAALLDRPLSPTTCPSCKGSVTNVRPGESYCTNPMCDR
jgi:hypothetical protein